MGLGSSSQQKEKGTLSHEHTLFHRYVENGTTKERCDVCRKELYGMVYGCQVCKFCRHGSCAKKQMPLKITHPCHSMHDLKLTVVDEASDFLCELCFCNSRGPRYHCYDCLIDFDLACVSSTPSNNIIVAAGRGRNRTKHFSHGEPLALFKYRKATKYYQLDCNWCDKPLSGMCYGCFEGGGPYFGCKFFLHQSCISKIPRKLQHPFHPKHHLYVQYCERDYGFHCNACKRPILTATRLVTYYACHDCGFYLHISCARMLPTLEHKCHKHSLSYFSRSGKERLKCNSCRRDCNALNNKELGALYRCVQCNFNIHFKCLPAAPMAKHRYHRHFLVLRAGVVEDDSGEYYCDICEEERNPKHHIYYCKECTYIGHVECLLKEVSDSEAREMMDLVKRVQHSNGKFPRLKQTGGDNIDRNQDFEMKEIQFLLKDLEQEKKEKKKDKEKYYEEDEDEESSSSSSDDDDNNRSDDSEEEEEEEEEDSEEEEEEESEEEEDIDIEEMSEEEEDIDKEELGEEEEDIDKKELGEEEEIDHFSHWHPLTLFHLTENHENGKCNACLQELNGTVYICQTCEFPFHYGLHKACTKLPYELEQQPLHPQHPLTFLSKYPHSNTAWFVCDECGDFSCGGVYLCMDCQFKLDVKCAILNDPEIRFHEPKHREKETEYRHFSHEHMLVLGNLVHESMACSGCNLPIIGPAYRCLECHDHIIHESCYRLLPKEIQHPFHPLHPLVAFHEYANDRKCHACKMEFRLGFIRYGCLQCQFDLHFTCANSLRRVLRSSSHMHDLYYFGPDSQLFLRRFGELHDINFLCSVCNEIFEGPFYRCVECGINFHLKCVPVPQIIKSKCHFHPLTLKDSFVEDDSGEHYCDVCEEERHPKDHVYCCDECEGLFVAHIECALPMMEETSQARRSISLMEPEFGESSIQAERQELIFHEAKDNSV